MVLYTENCLINYIVSLLTNENFVVVDLGMDLQLRTIKTTTFMDYKTTTMIIS